MKHKNKTKLKILNCLIVWPMINPVKEASYIAEQELRLIFFNFANNSCSFV